MHKRLGILGGGQLGKMIFQAGSPKHLPISIMEKSEDCPAFHVCPDFIKGDITRYEDVMAFGQNKDLITIEIENVNVEALRDLEKSGVEVYPQPDVLDIIKDKGKQKQFYKDNDIPTAEFSLYNNAVDIKLALTQGKIYLPLVQKTRKDGYDGRGVQVLKSEQSLSVLFDVPSVIENLVPIRAEISVIVARNKAGQMTAFPPVQMEFHPTANLVEFLFAPTEMEARINDEAVQLAKKVAETMGIVGLLAVEMFVDKKNRVLVNEVAPRPHNSGHHTIEANYVSQYEQHIRAITGMPLGSTRAHHAAAMVNVLGAEGYEGKAVYQGLDNILKLEGVYVHLYGKTSTKPFRKMGHITVIGNSLQEVKEKAKFIYNTIKVTT